MHGTRKLACHVELRSNDVQGAVPLQGGASVHLVRGIGACLEEGNRLRPLRRDPLVDGVAVQQPLEDEARLVGTQVVHAVHVDRRGIGVVHVQDVGGWHFNFPYRDGISNFCKERQQRGIK